MRVLVIGGAGFIGRSLCRRLLALNHDVRILDIGKGPPPDLGGATYLSGSFLNLPTLEAALADRDICFHLASTTLPATSNNDVIFDLETNLRGGVVLIEATVRARIARVVFLSSGGTVYGVPQTVPITEDHPLRPICAYGVSKAALEAYFNLYFYLRSLDYRVLRLANPYGPGQPTTSGQGVISIFLDRVARGQPIEIWGDGRAVRDFIFIEDVVDAICAAALGASDEKIFNVGSGFGCSVIDALNCIQSVVGKKAEVQFKDARNFDVPINVLDTTRMSRAFGWKPRHSFVDGLTKTWNAYKRDRLTKSSAS